MKTPLTLPPGVPQKWAWHYRALLRLRDTLAQEHATRNDALRTPRAEGGHDAMDVASEQQERNSLLAELTVEEVELSEIDAALRRIREGTYGICEETGRPVSAARLRALPWTRLSREAAARVEKLPV